MPEESVRSESGYRRYFSIIPNMVVDDPRLTLHDRALYYYYARICGDGGRCFRSRDRIAREVGMSVRQTQTCRKHLAELGYISVQESDRSVVIVQMSDVWDENVSRYQRGGGVQHSTGGVQENTPKKKDPDRIGSGSDPEQGMDGVFRGSPDQRMPPRRAVPSENLQSRHPTAVRTNRLSGEGVIE